MSPSQDILHIFEAHWPTLAAVATFIIGMYYCAKFLALTSEAVSQAFGPLGKYWQARRLISHTEADDLRRRLQYLAEQVRALRHRDECYFSYTLYDHEWHRKHELLAITNGWILPPHTSFPEYRATWMKDKGLHEEVDLWM